MNGKLTIIMELLVLTENQIDYIFFVCCSSGS